MFSPLYSFLFLISFYSQRSLSTVFSSSLKSCQDQCSERNLAFPLARGELFWSPVDFENCGYSCHITSCHHGCHDLDDAESKCITRCAEEGISFESCIQGCQAVEQAFLVQVQELVSEVGVSIDVIPEGTHLKWEFSEGVSQRLQEIAATDVQWFAQIRPRNNGHGWQWNPLPATAFRNNSLTADVIVPTEKVPKIEVRLAAVYRKRVAVANGVSYQLPPTVIPLFLEIESHHQISTDKYAICWTSNRELPKFRVVVVTVDGTAVHTKETDKTCILLHDLPPEVCRVTVADVTSSDEATPGPEASINIELKHVEADLLDTEVEQPILIFSNGSHLLQMSDIDDYVAAKQPINIPFVLTEGDTFTAVCSLSVSELVVGTAFGSLWHLSLEYNGTEVTSEAKPIHDPEGEGHLISQMTYDPIQRFLYCVIQDKGVMRCPIDEGSPCTFSPNTDSLNPVRQLTIDGLNGYFYFLGADHQVYRAELFPFNSGETHTFTEVSQIAGLSQTGAMEFNTSTFELWAALKNGTVVTYDVISTEIKLKKTEEFSEVSRMHVLGERVFWTRDKCGESSSDEACFYSEEVHRQGEEEPAAETTEASTKNHFGRYVYHGKMTDFTFLHRSASRFSNRAPREVSMISGDTTARILWMQANISQFEAPTLKWQNVTYELFITTPDGTVQTKTTNETELELSINPGVEYSLKVRACIEEICSDFIETTDTTFATFKEIPFIFLRKSSESNEALDAIARPVDIVSTLGSALSVDVRKSFAIDNTTVTSFAVNPSETSLLRSSLANPQSDPVLFTSYSTIRHVSIMPNRALIYIASHYQIAAFRLTRSFEFLFYSCSVITECGEVVGLSTDDTSGDIHFALRFPNGTFSLFEASQEDRVPRMLAESSTMPEIRQMLITNEKIVFLTLDGHIGYCDKHLRSINIDHNTVSVDHILPIATEHATNMASFAGEIAMNTEKKSELLWNVEPRQILGNTLFKVSMFRDKLTSGDSRVEVTIKNELTVPEDLLESWSSAQRFDVVIEGITAWTVFSVNKSSLQAPVKPPSAPTNTRLYATQQKTVDGARAIISFFWNPPQQWNGTPFQYVVNCTKEDGIIQSDQLNSGVTHYAFAVKSGKVTCQVAASNEPSNIGAWSEQASIDSSELKPLVRLFAIDSTNALMAITNISSDETGRREKRQVAQVNRMEYQAIAFIGNDLFAVRKEPDSIQPLLVQIDTNDIDNIVHKVSIGGDVARIDAMTSDWVGNRLLFVSGMALYQMSLDPFLTTSLLNPRKLIDLSTGATDAKQLTFDPFKNTAYLLTRNGSLFALNLALQQERNLALSVNCLASQTVTWMMTEFAWNRASSPKIYALTWNGLIVVDLDENNKCDEVRIDWNKFGEKGLKAMSAFAIADKLFVFVTSSEMLIYGRETVVPIPINNPPLRQILAVSQSSQPFPDRSCFSLPSSTGIQFNVINEGKTGSFLEVQKPPPPTVCHNVSFPQTHYEVYFTRKNADKVKHIRSFSEKIHVENGILDKETEYEVTVAWLNRYSGVSGISDTKPFRTGFGYPSAPRDLNVVSVTPDTVYLYWSLPETLNAPINEIKYKISQQASGLSSPSTVAVQEFSDGAFVLAPSDSASCQASPCRVKISNLRPSTEYKFWSTAIHSSHLNAQFLEDSEAVSQEATARTKDIAGTLRPDNVTGSSILLRWNSLQAEEPPSTISVQYKEAGSTAEWKAPSNASFEPNVTTILVMVNNLLSATAYDYRFVAAYTGTYSVGGKHIAFKEDYYQGVQQLKTKAGVPTMPQSVEARQDEEGWIVSWMEPSSDGGSPITSYAVEMRQNRTSEWEIAERGLDGWKLWWRPAKSAGHQVDWEFRVRAANQEGFGPYANSADNRKDQVSDSSEGSSLYLVILAVLAFIILVFAAIFCLLRARRRALLRKKEEADDRNCITLEKMAGHHAPNQPLSPEMANELKNLPHVKSENVLLEHKIGCGSFGDVYEGMAMEIPMMGKDFVKVAVKCLKRGYVAADKIKFMKEAILMNNFDHPNIVKLLGVCLDRDPLYLLLELMEEGDLLTVLRRSSSELQSDSFDSLYQLGSCLKLRDLLSMMVDIGRGGAYLESNRHVHRDLAARNCLVTVDSSGHRVTKIADFGLARGVFNNDYYRVRGEDFLPLRWLAPESALNGVFSSKSDVWAFGILLYEIMSLGLQPYGDMNNQEVLAHLKNRGTPAKLPCCPKQLYQLMLKCWSWEPDHRPSFSELLQQFEALRDVPEFQDDKPFSPFGAHYNGAFNDSRGSTNSDKDHTMQNPSTEHNLFAASGRSYTGSEKMLDPNRFDQPGGGSSRSGRHKSIIRSLRKEKPKPAPLPSSEEIDARLQYANSSRSSTYQSNDTASSYDYGDTPSYVPSPTSRSAVVFNLPSNLSSYEAALNRRGALELDGRMNNGMAGVNLSKSWAAGSHMPHSERSSNHPTMPSGEESRSNLTGVSSQPILRPKRQPHPSNSTHSYSNPRHSKVSQV